MQSQLNYLMDVLRRIAGDAHDSTVPEELRSKGLLAEIREDQSAFYDEQRRWKVENDAQVAAAIVEREQLRTNQERMCARLEKLEQNTSKSRRLFVWVVRWITRKDDGFSIAIAKLVAVGAFIATSGVGIWKGLGVVLHALGKLVIYLTRVK